MAEANRIFNTAFSLLTGIDLLLGCAAFAFAGPIVQLFGCPPSAVEFAVSYLRIYACGTLFVMLAQGLNPFILTQGYSLIAMGSILVGVLINMALDPLLIFTLGMGVRGSSLATVISQLCSCLCVVAFFFTRTSLFRFRVREMRLSLARLASILSLGVTPLCDGDNRMRYSGGVQYQPEPCHRRGPRLHCGTHRDAQRAAADLPAAQWTWQRCAALRQL